MNRTLGYGHTLKASYLGYVTQAVVNNLAPLLFLTFQAEYGISLEKITLLITLNFGIQLLVDLLSTGLIDRIGYRRGVVAAHVFAALGIAGLAIWPDLISGGLRGGFAALYGDAASLHGNIAPLHGDAYPGILISVILYALGGGLIEVLISPIVEACPTDEKEAAMSLLHSFYCWGHVAVVILSTVFLAVAGRNSWRALCLLWAVLPVCNAFYFLKVPILSLDEVNETVPVRTLLMNKLFWVFFVLMLCSGASEQAMSQWASAFAEAGLKVPKTIGDLAGPCMFAALMGTARVLHAKLGGRISLRAFMLGSGGLCIFSYLLAVYAPIPVLGLVGCGICGFSVGVLWPGTFSLASRSMPGGGTAMFALLALAGDLGCSFGPTVVGMASAESGSIRGGLLMAILFPIMLCIGVLLWSVMETDH